MKKSILYFLLIIFFTGCSTHAEFVKFESEPFLSVPESVLWDSENEMFYVSNINGKPDAFDGNGFISKIDKDLKPVEIHWIDNLNAPKGMCISNGYLFVTDIDRIIVINISKGIIENEIAVTESVFLNDIAVYSNYLIASDNKQHCIFYIKNDGIRKSSVKLSSANGLFVYSNKLYVGANKSILEFSPEEDRIVSVLVKNCGNVDGLYIDASKILYSNYLNKITLIEGTSKYIIDSGIPLKDAKTDLCVTPSGLIAVPDFHTKILLYKRK